MSEDEEDPLPAHLDKASLDYQAKFGLPPDELLHQEFSCALSRRLLMQGRLWVSQHFLCFYSNLLVSEATLVLRADSIQSVELAKVLIFPTALRLLCHDGSEHVFASFLHREQAYRLLQRVVKGERIGRQRVKTSRQLDQDMRALTQHASAASAAMGTNHQQLLDKRAHALKQSRMRSEADEGAEDGGEDTPANGSARSSRNRRSDGAGVGRSARGRRDPTPPPDEADDAEEDDALSLFRKPTAGKGRAKPRRAEPEYEREEQPDAAAWETQAEEGGRRARGRKASRRPVAVDPEEEEGGEEDNDAVSESDEVDEPPEDSPHAPARTVAAARKPLASDLLVVPSQAGAGAPHTPGSAPQPSSRKPSSASARKPHMSDDDEGHDGRDPSDDEGEFGSHASIFDPIPTYALPDPRVTRIARRFRDLASPLDVRNRRLIHEGFIRRQGKLSAVDRWCFLFTDHLLFAKIVEPEVGGHLERYDVKQRCDLVKMIVDARPVEFQLRKDSSASASSSSGGALDLLKSTRLPNAFRIISQSPEQATYVVSVSTLQEKYNWVSALQFAIARHMLLTGHPATTASAGAHNEGWFLKPVRGTIHQAAFEGDLPLLRALLKADPSPSHVNARLERIDGSTALHLAVAARRDEVVSELLGPYAADQTVRDREGLVPLHVAAKRGYVETVRLLLRYSDPAQARAAAASSASSASAAGKSTAAKPASSPGSSSSSSGYVQPSFDHSLWHPPPPPASSSTRSASLSPRAPRILREQSALWMCALARLRDWQAVFRLLVAHASQCGGGPAAAKSLLDDRDEQGHTLLESCVLGSLEVLVPLLAECGASLDLFSPTEGTTPLGLAIQYNNMALVTCLVELGAQLNIRKKPSMVAPIHLVPRGEVDMAVFLIEHGARLHMPSGGRVGEGSKLQAVFDSSESHQSALEEALEGRTLRPILFTNQTIKLPPSQHASQSSCQICADEFAPPHSNTGGHGGTRRKDYCRSCGLSVCGACATHKLAFPLLKSGQRTTKPPPAVPTTSAAGGQSTFAPPPPLDPNREVASVCDGCYNAHYARSVRLRKDRRRRRKARQAARQAALAAGEEGTESDEHASEVEDGAEGAVYDGVEAAHHAAQAAATLAQEAAGAHVSLGGSAVALVNSAVHSAADGMLALVGLKQKGGSGSSSSGGGVSSSEVGRSKAAQAADAFNKFSKLFTSVTVTQPPPRSSNSISTMHGTIQLRPDARQQLPQGAKFKDTARSHNAAQPNLGGGGGGGGSSVAPRDGPAMAMHAGSTEEQQRIAMARSASRRSGGGGAGGQGMLLGVDRRSGGGSGALTPSRGSPHLRPLSASASASSSRVGTPERGRSRQPSDADVPLPLGDAAVDDEAPRGRSTRSSKPTPSKPRSSATRSKQERWREDDGDEE